MSPRRRTTLDIADRAIVVDRHGDWYDDNGRHVTVTLGLTWDVRAWTAGHDLTFANWTASHPGQTWSDHYDAVVTAERREAFGDIDPQDVAVERLHVAGILGRIHSGAVAILDKEAREHKDRPADTWLNDDGSLHVEHYGCLAWPEDLLPRNWTKAEPRLVLVVAPDRVDAWTRRLGRWLELIEQIDGALPGGSAAST
jgi:hypothetical protein